MRKSQLMALPAMARKDTVSVKPKQCSSGTSHFNVFEPPLSSSSSGLKKRSKPMAAAPEFNRNIVKEIVDGFFDEKVAFVDVSSSRCSSESIKPGVCSYDRRIKYWKDMLAERKLIEQHIKQKTGKKSKDMLFNRLTTIDERDKNTVKRLMDYADRLNPVQLTTLKHSVLPEVTDACGCIQLNELQLTLPRAEQEQQKIVEIIGVPSVTRAELLGDVKQQGQENKWQWLKSKVLQERICQKRADIERVIEYYPDIEHLQIVGQNAFKALPMKHNPEIKLLADEIIKEISTDTPPCPSMAYGDANKISKEEVMPFGLKINEQYFYKNVKRTSKNVEIEIKFECETYQTVVKRVLRIENVGTKVLNFEWCNRAYFEKNCELLKAYDDEFLFDKRPFRLLSGEIRDIYVKFQPRRVNILKEKWILKIDPQIFFCRKVDSVIVKLAGKCNPSNMYLNKTKTLQMEVIKKSNLAMMQKLTTGLASITPLIKPFESICPYKRVFNERELFEAYNVGYKCERFHDLQLLKDIYKRLKKPREPMWDLKLNSLKAMILRQMDAERRALIYAEMLSTLNDMKGYPNVCKDDEVICENPERDRSRLIFVRGIICTCIDEWEELALSVENVFFKAALKDYYDRLNAQQEEEQLEEEEEAEEQHKGDHNINSHKRVEEFTDEEAINEHVLKHVRRSKATRDSIYMQTYTMLCDVVENIVSIIESTENI